MRIAPDNVLHKFGYFISLVKPEFCRACAGVNAWTRFNIVMNAFVATCLLAVLLARASDATSDFDLAWASTEFVDGRATYFGRSNWSLNEGSCGFGFVCPNRWSDELASGYDLVAISDQSPLYSGSHTGAQCGRCLEVKCRSASIPDMNGAQLDRHGLCKNDKSVKVKVVDTCDCSYPENAASNARWCCGDAPHLDMSQWAIDKIVDQSSKWGVFAIAYRPIGCQDELPDQAPEIAIPTSPHDSDRPAQLDCSTQRYGSKGSIDLSRGRKLSNQPQRGQHASFKRAVWKDLHANSN